MDETVILVNEIDEMIGTHDKLKTHEDGVLHRAFSIFILNASGQLLIQRRASTKYHSKDLWSNTCCGHPRPWETVEEAAHRRLMEEMGFDCKLKSIFSFIYRATLDSNLTEYEYDHVFVGHFDGNPTPSFAEVQDWRWVDARLLINDIHSSGQEYTVWLKLSLERVIAYRLATDSPK